jgi:hypothetical protein
MQWLQLVCRSVRGSEEENTDSAMGGPRLIGVWGRSDVELQTPRILGKLKVNWAVHQAEANTFTGMLREAWTDSPHDVR